MTTDDKMYVQGTEFLFEQWFTIITTIIIIIFMSVTDMLCGT